MTVKQLHLLWSYFGHWIVKYFRSCANPDFYLIIFLCRLENTLLFNLPSRMLKYFMLRSVFAEQTMKTIRRRSLNIYIHCDVSIGTVYNFRVIPNYWIFRVHVFQFTENYEINFLLGSNLTTTTLNFNSPIFTVRKFHFWIYFEAASASLKLEIAHTCALPKAFNSRHNSGCFRFISHQISF